jgi:hypothetical protein
MISAAHAKKSAMGLPMYVSLSEEDWVVNGLPFDFVADVYEADLKNSINEFVEAGVNVSR